MSENAASFARFAPSFPTLAVAMSAIGFGTVPFFAKSLADAGMAAASIAFYRYLVAAVVLLPFLRVRPQSRTATLWAMFAGAAMGIGWTGYVKSIEFMPVSSAAIIYMTYPGFTIAIAWAFFRQQVRYTSVLAAALIALAAVLVLAPSGSLHVSATGLLFAFAAPLTFGLAINILAIKLDGIPALSRISGLGLGAVLGLLPMVTSLPPDQLLANSTSAWWMIAGICLATALGPQLLYVINAPCVGPTKSAMLGGLELPTTILIGWFVFNEPMLMTQFAAAGLVIAAIMMAPSSKSSSIQTLR